MTRPNDDEVPATDTGRQDPDAPDLDDDDDGDGDGAT
jgi:hypothetical protein